MGLMVTVSIMTLSVTLSVTMLSVVLLSVVLLSVTILIVMAPAYLTHQSTNKFKLKIRLKSYLMKAQLNKMPCIGTTDIK
jgi:hypothetical protein